MLFISFTKVFVILSIVIHLIYNPFTSDTKYTNKICLGYCKGCQITTVGFNPKQFKYIGYTTKYFYYFYF